ncbi:MAG TPA: hypothetical protein DIC22_07275 [Chitinophagaceae bacterium]|nr:hypothetical protein [Chitinophagaceae bacterium]
MNPHPGQFPSRPSGTGGTRPHVVKKMKFRGGSNTTNVVNLNHEPIRRGVAFRLSYFVHLLNRLYEYHCFVF